MNDSIPVIVLVVIYGLGVIVGSLFTNISEKQITEAIKVCEVNEGILRLYDYRIDCKNGAQFSYKGDN